jgi:hypothetical protein
MKKRRTGPGPGQGAGAAAAGPSRRAAADEEEEEKKKEEKKKPPKMWPVVRVPAGTLGPEPGDQRKMGWSFTSFGLSSVLRVGTKREGQQ